MNNFKKILFMAGIFAVAGSAVAVPITGSIGFTGDFTLNGSDFTTSTTITPTSASVNGSTSGSYFAEGITAGDTASYSAFTYSPTTTPVLNIWSVGSFTFNLETMVENFKNASSINLSGSGTVSSTTAGLDDAHATWEFSANSAGSNFTWSSSSDVPAPGIALIMAMGLAGVSLASKARKST